MQLRFLLHGIRRRRQPLRRFDALLELGEPAYDAAGAGREQDGDAVAGRAWAADWKRARAADWKPGLPATSSRRRALDDAKALCEALVDALRWTVARVHPGHMRREAP
ncbi:hypothetical protein GCM10010317_016040 [Streptomyces mirabilis]|nr:hypothetical protein GCM10010317_016040 [Streptomyces mirabilis]